MECTHNGLKSHTPAASSTIPIPRFFSDSSSPSTVALMQTLTQLTKLYRIN
jgi:hypothetical protein